MLTVQHRTTMLKKENFLNNLKANGFNISKACKETQIARRTYYDWLESDEEFKSAIEETQEQLIDEAEQALKDKIVDGDTTSIIFFLKTKGKQRGYVERQEVKSEHSGSMKVIHEVIWE